MQLASQFVVIRLMQDCFLSCRPTVLMTHACKACQSAKMGVGCFQMAGVSMISCMRLTPRLGSAREVGIAPRCRGVLLQRQTTFCKEREKLQNTNESSVPDDVGIAHGH